MSESNERKFLHDIANPLGTAMFVVDMLIDSMKNRPDADPNELKQTEQVYGLMQRMKKMIEERRAELIKLGHPSSKS